MLDSTEILALYEMKKDLYAESFSQVNLDLPSKNENFELIAVPNFSKICDSDLMSELISQDNWLSARLFMQSAPLAYVDRLNRADREIFNDALDHITADSRKIFENEKISSEYFSQVRNDFVERIKEDLIVSTLNVEDELYFKDLVKIYLAGALPCGWDGEMPGGTLYVY